MGRAARPAPWEPRWKQLVRAVVRVHSGRGEQQLLDWLTRVEEPTVLAFVNAHAMNSAAVSDRFFRAIMSANVVLRDGIGMAILMGLLNQRPGLNLNGTDLIPKILQRYRGSGIALFGTQEPWLSAARDTVLARLAPDSRIVLAHGFHETTVYVRVAAAHRPRLIVLGMGMPKQEEVAQVLRAALGFPCLIICGGAIIDFLGNKTSRAPAWMRRTGLEWAYRLALEPRRLFQRYVIGNPLFVARALNLAAHLLRQEGKTVCRSAA
ncbi:b-glycosyltransferase, Glycosyltransferase Family 26-like protein [Ramlibacter tataouinensis TTB310]|uniref:B-glycosyltransferase, Glycosyltransferase Family 26-like protein n=2 Tax=Ramlibacter tataouinensis TaxID=94132 RepID=F5Y0E5_RAMTT|nr:b-glycosyltransferase, Glycosyltransferase Family 26-like protein [Ramlibacter tataouinensis TTB310]